MLDRYAEPGPRRARTAIPSGRVPLDAPDVARCTRDLTDDEVACALSRRLRRRARAVPPLQPSAHPADAPPERLRDAPRRTAPAAPDRGTPPSAACREMASGDARRREGDAAIGAPRCGPAGSRAPDGRESSVSAARLQQQRPAQGTGVPHPDRGLGHPAPARHHAPLRRRRPHPEDDEDVVRRAHRPGAPRRDGAGDDAGAAQGDVHRPARRPVRLPLRRGRRSAQREGACQASRLAVGVRAPPRRRGSAGCGGHRAQGHAEGRRSLGRRGACRCRWTPVARRSRGPRRRTTLVRPSPRRRPSAKRRLLQSPRRKLRAGRPEGWHRRAEGRRSSSTSPQDGRARAAPSRRRPDPRPQTARSAGRNAACPAGRSAVRSVAEAPPAMPPRRPPVRSAPPCRRLWPTRCSAASSLRFRPLPWWPRHPRAT